MTYLYKICHQSGRVLFTTDNEVTARNREQFGWKVIVVDKSRAQFEAEMAKLGDCVDMRRAKNGDEEYMEWDVRLAWRFWNLSRAAIEIELPRRKIACASGYGEGYLVDSLMGDALDYDETVEAIRAAGFKVKE